MEKHFCSLVVSLRNSWDHHLETERKGARPWKQPSLSVGLKLPAPWRTARSCAGLTHTAPRSVLGAEASGGCRVRSFHPHLHPYDQKILSETQSLSELDKAWGAGRCPSPRPSCWHILEPGACVLLASSIDLCPLQLTLHFLVWFDLDWGTLSFFRWDLASLTVLSLSGTSVPAHFAQLCHTPASCPTHPSLPPSGLPSLFLTPAICPAYPRGEPSYLPTLLPHHVELLTESVL